VNLDYSSKSSHHRPTRGWLVIAAVLLAPAVAAIIRKFWPGQPVFIEALPGLAIIIGFLWALPKAKGFPGYIAVPIIIWAVIQGIYVIPTALHSETLAVAALFVRMTPLMMPVIAFAAIRSSEDFRSMAVAVGAITLGALPVGIIAAFWGEAGLPFWLRAIDAFSFGGSQLRAGLPAVSFVFSTPAVLSTSVAATLYLSIAAIRIRGHSTQWNRLLILIAVGSLLLLFLSTRRGMLFVGMFALVSLIWGGSGIRISSTKLIVFAASIIGVFLVINIFGFNDGRTDISRFEFITSIDFLFRFNDIFLDLWSFWFQTAPLGNGLGTAGPEAQALNILTHQKIYSVVEIGGAQLLEEMGVLGGIGLPVVLAAMIFSLYTRSRKTSVEGPVITLIMFLISVFLLFYVKEKSILTGMWVIVLSFWATPGICAALIIRNRESRSLPDGPASSRKQ